ncbi:MAG: hypothetical protein ACFFDN_29175 [Candidatus Hodarchaeota archaeon]
MPTEEDVLKETMTKYPKYYDEIKKFIEFTKKQTTIQGILDTVPMLYDLLEKTRRFQLENYFFL